MEYYSLWKKFNSPEAPRPLKEEKGRSRQRGIYKFLFMCGYTIESGQSQRGLDDIASDIRALPNVTIVTVVVGNKNIGNKQYIAGLSVKFLSSNPGEFLNPEDTKKRILRDIRKVRNVQRLYRVSVGIDRLE